VVSCKALNLTGDEMRKLYDYCWLRSPRTYQERRHSVYEKEFARASRNASNLPTSYDDIFVWHKRKKHVCWKELRLTQHKPIMMD